MGAANSPRNWGPPPKTTPIGGKNFQPDAMNPDLWPVFNDEGRRMINARIRPENTRLMGGGLDAFNLVNSPLGKQMGLGYKQAEATVQSMRSKLSDPNRALFNLNPYASEAPAVAQPQGPTPDQMRWAKMFADTQPVANPNSADQSLAGAAFGSALATPASRPVAPTNFSRAALIEGAKKSGEFNDIMQRYNRDAAGTGFRMDDQGSIKPISKLADNQGTSPFAREVYGAGAADVQARRDLARGEAPVRKFDPMAGPNADEMNPRPVQFSKMNPYGSAMLEQTPSKGGMMRHEITGKMVPMSPYLAEKRAIQDTKLGNQPLDSTAAQRIRRLILNGGVA